MCLSLDDFKLLWKFAGCTTELHDVVVRDTLCPPSVGMATAGRLLGSCWCCCSESWKPHRST